MRIRLILLSLAALAFSGCVALENARGRAEMRRAMSDDWIYEVVEGDYDNRF